ncbi:MAG: pyridoxamine 5'-phosphate oxidase [Acidimicrobiales bacterium]
MSRFVRVVGLAAGAFFLGGGLWALLGPRSFYDNLATYPPYNRHLFHDLGAFQIGLGVAILLAFVGWDGWRVGLWSVTAASVLHAVSHVVDRDLGGRESDPYSISALALVLVAAVIVSNRLPRSEDSPDASAPPVHRLRTDTAARSPQPH